VQPLSNAERQRRWREKRNALARQAGIVRNAPLDLLIKDREKRECITATERRRAVQQLLKTIDPEEDAALLSWLRSWLRSGRQRR
jgi:hypothetical protein